MTTLQEQKPMEFQNFMNIISTIQSTASDQLADLFKKINQFFDLYSIMINTPIYPMALYKTTEYIMRLKQTRQQVSKFSQMIILNIIERIIQTNCSIGIDCLRLIFDSNNQYYRHHFVDKNLDYPLGFERLLDKSYEPQIGDQCDVIKPYITSTSFCSWTRCTLIQKQGKSYTLAYANTSCPTTVKQRPFFAPLGSRTLDFDWRMNLTIGQKIDALHQKTVWYSSTVVQQQTQNNVKKVRVSYRSFDDHGDRIDFQGNKYFGLGPNQDEWIDVLSPRIQKEGKMHKKLCYYSLESNQFILDDSYDLIFEKQYNQKPFHGLMRMTFCRSTSFLMFYNKMCDLGIHQIFNQYLKNSDLNNDITFSLMVVLTNCQFMVPHMAIKTILYPNFVQSFNFIASTIKNLNGNKLEILFYFLSNYAGRCLSLTQKYATFVQLKKTLVPVFLNQNLQKQLLGLKVLNDLVKPYKPYSFQQRQNLIKYFKENKIFYALFKPGAHQQIFQRSADFIKSLLPFDIINWQQLDYLWNLMPQSDLRGRGIIQKMFSDLSKALPLQYAEKLIDKLLNLKQTDLTVDNLNLLRQLKNRQDLTQFYLMKVWQFLWDIITKKSMNIKHNIQQEVQKVFRGLITVLKDPKLRGMQLKLMCNRLSQITKLNNEAYLMKQYILSYPKSGEKPQKIEIQQQSKQQKNNDDLISQEIQYPMNIKQAVMYLKKQNIYQTLLNLLQNNKNNDKVNYLLQFIRFLFTYDDDDDINQIVSKIYQKTGPNDNFLTWGKTIADRAKKFFIQLFEKSDLKQFVQITPSGWDNLKSVLIDINVQLGNLKILCTKTRPSIKTDNSTTISTGTGPETQNTSNLAFIGPVTFLQSLNQNSKQFIYTLKSPEEIKGMNFLEELLLIIKDHKVYTDIINLLVGFIVNLDQSIIEKAKQFIEDFLKKMMDQINSILRQNIFNDSIKIKFETYIAFIEELLAETEQDGLENIFPHFQNFKAENYELKFENNMKSDKQKQFTLIVNQNCTLWSLKKRLADILNQDVKNIDVYKYKDPMSERDNGKKVEKLFFNGEMLKVDKKKIKQMPRHDLLNQDKSQLNPKFNQIVEGWYEKYNNHKQMGFDQLKKLATQCWKGSALKQQKKLMEIIQKFDLNKKGYLQLNEFKNFFISKSIENQAAVWKVINASGYKNNFKYKDEPEQIKIQSKIQPRKILSQKQTYKTLFNLLQNQVFQDLHVQFYKLVGILQTNQQIKNQIEISPYQSLKKSKGKYELAYTLQIILQIIQKNQDLYLNFFKAGGCLAITDILYEKTNNQKNIYTQDTVLKSYILPYLLKIINLYVYPLYFHIPSVKMIQDWKLNNLDIEQFQSKITAYQQDLKNKSKQKLDSQQLVQLSKNQILNIQLRKYTDKFNFEKTFQISQKIYKNLVLNYISEFLLKITNQITKILAIYSLQNNFPLNSFINVAKSQSLNLRRGGHNFILLHLRQFQNKIEPFLNELITQIPNQNKYALSHFFVLLVKIIAKAMERNKEDGPFIELAKDLLKKTYQCKCNQTRRAIISDKVLLGFLINIKAIFSKRESICKVFVSQKQNIIDKLLFFYNASQKIKALKITSEMLKTQEQPQLFENYIKCRSDDCRKILYQIIYLLHKASVEDDLFFFTRKIIPILNQFKQPKKGGFKITCVGLNNLGSTCYMNSMLQVLNSIGPFRNGIMKSNINYPLVNEMKKLFSYLFFSQRNDYIPKALLDSFNPPINPGIQQDTTQFLNYLFDQLQIPLKNTSFDSILNQTFRGFQVAQMICHACGKRRQRNEEFFTYSVDIQGKYELKSALQSMHQGEVINQCFCENCGVKSDTTKRSVISQVPNIFFMHLRRIVFNYDVFVNTKIHTRLQFPNQLNIQPYTKQGIDLRQSLGIEYLKSLNENEQQKKKFEQMTLHGKQKDFYNLKLKGVIVHSGTADVGHYYAIVNRQKNWMKFDDSRVSMFSASSFDSQCYGGNWQSDQWGGFGSSSNAYVLIYQKVNKKSILIQEGQSIVQIPYEKFEVYNDEQHYRQVWLDNHQLMLENQLIDINYCKDFLFFVCKILEISPQQNKIEAIALVLSKISVYSGQISGLQDLFNNSLGQITPQTLKKFILQDFKKTFNILFHHQKKIREFMSRFIEGVLIVVFKQGDPHHQAQIINFLQFLIGELHGQVAKNWMRIDGYLRLFKNIIFASVNFPQLYSVVIKHDFITKYIDFVMQKGSPLTISHKKYSLGTKSNPVNFSSALQIISFLLKRSYGFHGINYETPKPAQDQLFHLSDNDVICLSHIPFYQKMIRQRQNSTAISQILQRLCILNLPFTEAIARSMLKCINQNTDSNDQMKDMLQCVQQVLRIKDQYWTQRAQFILGYSTPYINDNNVLSSIEDQRFIYQSTLDDLFPVQCLFTYAYNNRLRFPLAITHILSTILKACSVSVEGMLYLARQVSPSYIHTRYIDWIRPYLNNVLGFVNLGQKEKQQFKKIVDYAKQLLKNIQSFAEDSQDQLPIPLITGIFNKNQLQSQIEVQGASVMTRKTQIFCLKSIPNSQGNSSIDQFLEHGRLDKQVDNQSNILKLFKMTKPAIVLKLNPVEQPQDKQIIGLFDQNPKSLNTQQQTSTMEMEPPVVYPNLKILQKSKQQNKQTSKDQQQNKLKMEQQLPIVNIQNLQTKDYFKQIEIANKTDFPINVTLKFDKTKKINANLPSKISFLVTNKATDSMWLFKQKPDENWGDIKFDIEVTPVNKNANKTQQIYWFKTYGQRNQEKNESKNLNNTSELQNQNQNQNQQNNKMEIEYPSNQENNSAVQTGDEMYKQCPICTYLNFPGIYQCQICGSPI